MFGSDRVLGNTSHKRFGGGNYVLALKKRGGRSFILKLLLVRPCSGRPPAFPPPLEGGQPRKSETTILLTRHQRGVKPRHDCVLE